jgi:PAS domain S-box-containing protein
MIKGLVLSIIVLLMATPVVAQVQQPKDKLVIAISTDFQPFTFLNAEGQPAGMFVDIWRLWAQKTGKQIDAIVQKWFTTRVEYRPNWSEILKWALLIGGVFVLILGLSLLWNRRLAKEIDIRKQADETVREANEYLNNLIRYANAPIIVWDPEFRITRFNHAFEKMTGRTDGNVIGNNLKILFPPALVDSSMQLIKKTLLGERWETVEISILHVEGAVYSVLWNSATIFAADGITPVATIAQGHDITERKRAEEERIKLERQLQQARKAESLGRMAGAIAHHFNNKLMIVTGNLELALIHAGPNQKLSAHLSEAQRATVQAADVSGLMLAYLGQTLPKAETLDLAKVAVR